MKYILRPTKIKIVLNIIFSFGVVLAAILLPVLGISGTFSRLALQQKIISFFLSWMITSILYYPFVCALAHLVNSIKNSVYRAREIILALIFIAVFNPLSISLIISRILPRHSALPTGQKIQKPI